MTGCDEVRAMFSCGGSRGRGGGRGVEEWWLPVGRIMRRKGTEPEEPGAIFMDLFITLGSRVLKGRGNFPGHRPDLSERVKRTAEEGWSDETAGSRRNSSPVFAARKRHERANVWRLFAEAAGGLMSLKGQMLLGKINGIFKAPRGRALHEVRLDTIPEAARCANEHGKQVGGRRRRRRGARGASGQLM